MTDMRWFSLSGDAWRLGDALDLVSKRINIFISLASLALISMIDNHVDPEVGFAIFYLLPIFLVVWGVGRPWHIVMPVLAAAIQNRTLELPYQYTFVVSY